MKSSKLPVTMLLCNSSSDDIRRTTAGEKASKRTRRRRKASAFQYFVASTPSSTLFLALIILSCLGGSGPSHQKGSSRPTYLGTAYAEILVATSEEIEQIEQMESTMTDFDDETPQDIETDQAQNALTTEMQTWDQILVKAAKRGLGGGLPGAVAGVVQVVSLMWLRTIINYQIRYGSTFKRAVRTLYQDGGLARFYQGWPFALVQAPLSRFISTAANDGVNSLLGALTYTEQWGAGRTTVVASILVGLARMVLMPIDTCKTVLQVNSKEGFRSLIRRVKAGKMHVLYEGAVASAVSALVAHYPWFYTYNVLSKNDYAKELISSTLVRNAGIGLVASMVSDTVVNAVRVVKTTKQSIASKHSVSYSETISIILASGGWKGLFGRGLRTRIVANALQSIVFTVIWRGLAERRG